MAADRDLGWRMLIDSWLLQHAAELAEQAATQLAAAATSIQHEAHILLEEITQRPAGLREGLSGGINGGCQEQ
jgi:hypothetical protein